VVVYPKKGTPVRSRLPGTTHAQAENKRLLGRDVKAAVKHHINGRLHLWKTTILWKTKISVCPTQLGTAFQWYWKKETKSFAFRLPSITPLLKLICSLWRKKIAITKYQVPKMYVWRKMVAWLTLSRLAWIIAWDHCNKTRSHWHLWETINPKAVVCATVQGRGLREKTKATK